MSQIIKSVSSGPSPPIFTITGNDGVPESPVGNNFNIVTANATAKFAGSPGTETLDFGLSDLILGSDPSGLIPGGGNTGLGQDVLLGITSGIRNTGIGSGALQTVIGGFDNTAVGAAALNLGSGNSNVAVGSFALTAYLGSDTVAVGQAALGGLTTGVFNTAVGTRCLASSNANQNCAMGYESMIDVTSGANNTAFGTSTANRLLIGSNNCFFGLGAGQGYTNAESSNILIMNLGIAGESNTLRIGTQGASAGQQNRCFIAGISGASPNSVNTPQVTLCDNEGQLTAISSSTAGFVFTSNGTSTPSFQAPASQFIPNSVVRIKDDFLSLAGAGVSQILGEQCWSVSVAGGWISTDGIASSAHPGTIGHSSITSPAVRAFNMSNTSGAPFCFVLGGGQITYNWVFNIQTLSNSTNRYNLAFGMGDSALAAMTNGVWFGYSDNVNSGDWTINASIASTATNTNSAVAVTTGWHNGQIVINAAGTSAQYFMDGVSLGTVSTNLPATGIAPNFVVAGTSGTIAASSLVVDLFYLTQTLTTAR